MTRILATLSILSLSLVLAALAMGLSIGDLYHGPSHDTLRLATVHRLTGVAAAIGVVLVESIAITYFVGTSRWCKEVSETYHLDMSRVARSNQLKRRAFAVALLGMLAVVGVVALGGAADPATGRQGTQAWTIFHLTAALSGVAFVAWTYFAAWQYVWHQHAIIQQILAEVARIRRDKGLEPIDDGREIRHFSPVS